MKLDNKVSIRLYKNSGVIQIGPEGGIYDWRGERLLECWKDKKTGRKTFWLPMIKGGFRGAKNVTERADRAVYLAYHKNEVLPEKLFIVHLDGDEWNCAPENLIAFGSQKERKAWLKSNEGSSLY